MPSYPPVWTDQQIANQITRDGVHWNSTNLTYSFNNFSTGGNALDAAFQAWAGVAVQIISEMIGVNFTPMGAGAGDITFNGSSGNGTYASTSWNLPGNDITSADIYFDQTWNSNQSANLGYGSYGLTTIIHEFLHALGLQHPGNYNGSATYFADAEFRQDTARYSVMSYFDAEEDGSGTSHWFKQGADWKFIYPQTPMVYDLLALTDGNFAGYFAGYNLNSATRAGDTAYGTNPTAGINQVYNFAVNTAPVLTIYDAGGVDTLDLSGDFTAYSRAISYDAAGSALTTDIYRTTSVIDLRPGKYSSAYGMTNNIGIAFGTVIENAIGTYFNDTMTGNDAANILNGGLGVDSLFGGLGNDWLQGGGGPDNLNGGGGTDWFAFAGGGAAEGDVVSDYAANDYLYFGGTAALPYFFAAGADVNANGVYLYGAASGNVNVITQAAAALLGAAGLAPVQGALAGGLAGIAAYGAYAVTSYDANANEAWRTIEQGYTTANALDYVKTVYDAGQAYYAINNDYDQASNQNWSVIDSYYVSAALIDFSWITYDFGQALYSASINYDQAATENWSSIQTFFSSLNAIDFTYVYYDSGALFSAAVDYDQLLNQTWSRIETFLSAPGVSDFYWTYYDAGQPYFAATVDYDQAAAQTWASIQTFFSSVGVVDFTWYYYDAGQARHAVFIDEDQANVFAWAKHVIEYDTPGHVISDYYI